MFGWVDGSNLYFLGLGASEIGQGHFGAIFNQEYNSDLQFDHELDIRAYNKVNLDFTTNITQEQRRWRSKICYLSGSRFKCVPLLFTFKGA